MCLVILLHGLQTIYKVAVDNLASGSAILIVKTSRVDFGRPAYCSNRKRTMRTSLLTSNKMGYQKKKLVSGGLGGVRITVSGRHRCFAFRKRLFPVILLTLVIGVLTGYACTPETKIQDLKPLPGTQEAPAAAISKLSGQDEWQRLISAAKSEGKVIIYGEAGAMRGSKFAPRLVSLRRLSRIT